MDRDEYKRADALLSALQATAGVREVLRDTSAAQRTLSQAVGMLATMRKHAIVVPRGCWHDAAARLMCGDLDVATAMLLASELAAIDDPTVRVAMEELLLHAQTGDSRSLVIRAAQLILRGPAHRERLSPLTAGLLGLHGERETDRKASCPE